MFYVACVGYRNNPEATRNSFLDGFYRTGDIGIWKDGLIYVVDRLKELIKYKGLQVAPAELEALLISHPKISDAAVIGIPDVAAGEVPRAFLVKTVGANVDAQEIVKFVKENASDHKRLRGWVKFVDEIPKSASGKILRKELRQMNAERKSMSKL
jgi:acyl-CoA synthetase (AMP-forming)/AMP-acid ligase II